MNDYSNCKTNKFGEIGEQLFAKLMEQKGYIVESVTDEPIYWEQDIDFILTNTKTDVKTTFEVKWDSVISSTNNIFFETESNFYGGVKGWGYTSKAQYLAYGDSHNKAFLVISFNDIRDFEAETKPYHKTLADHFNHGMIVRRGALIDIDELMDWCRENHRWFMILREN